MAEVVPLDLVSPETSNFFAVPWVDQLREWAETLHIWESFHLGYSYQVHRCEYIGIYILVFLVEYFPKGVYIFQITRVFCVMLR